MAKYRNINHSELERAHFLRIERYAKLVDQIYQEAIKEFSQLAKTINFDPKKPFSFKDYPKTLNTANQLFKKLSDSVQITIANGNKEEWLHAAKKNDQLVNSILGNSRIEKKLLEKYMDRNLVALEAFQKRKIAGMGLSDRVWNQTQQFQKEIEMGLDLGLGEGKSASSLSRDLRSNLNEPERLFRRVRDKHGILHLSKNAEAYNPGQGVYRSSYKNALRLTRTETNMAYRESDYHRWQQLDFIVGIEIRLSNNPNHCPMCEALAGKYPKDFKFVGWHPQCRCRMISILKTDEELEDDIALILNDITPENVSENGIKSMPKGYNDWMSKNDERIKLAKSTPYFIRDNYKGGDVKKGLRFEVEKPKESSLHDLISELKEDNDFRLAIKEVEPYDIEAVYPSMQLEHKQLISDYTLSGSSDINKYLLGIKDGLKRNPALLKMYEENLNQALDSVPERFDGVVFRGINTRKTNYVEYYSDKYNKVGSVVIEPQFLSTSYDSPFLGPIQITYHVRSAAKIEKLSAFPNEKEVLLKSGMKFKVISFKIEDGKVFVGLEQI